MGKNTTTQILTIFKVLGLPDNNLMQDFYRFELGQTEEDAFVSLGFRDV